MPKRQSLLFSLARKRIRSSFNKFNLYNAMTWRKTLRRGTMFQQKFSAKQETRAYHGEKLTETQFRNVFAGELNGVNPLRSTRAGTAEAEPAKETPWALQTYLAIERRLDTAVFRSFFAASPRQAAQFIVKGHVKVNGVRIRQPGYELKPGDVFSVDPQAVLFAMGRRKPSVEESVKLVNRQIKRYNNYLARCRKYPHTMWRLRQKNRSKHPIFNKLYIKKQKKRAEAWNKQVRKEMSEKLDGITPHGVFRNILGFEPHFDAKNTIPVEGRQLTKSLSVLTLVTGKRLQPQAQESQKEAKEVKEEAQKETAEVKEEIFAPADAKRIAEFEKQYYGEVESAPANKSDVKKLVQEIIKIQQDEIRESHTAKLKSEADMETYDSTWVDRLPQPVPLIDVEAAKEDVSSVLPVRLPFSNGKLYGLADPSKGYFTPWNPRPFLAPFAVLPHHIEISFKTGHAVYLRDPVARPGHSEIISPFPLDMHERAYMFYIRKRRRSVRASS
ncbi:small ribosomal subunit protein uS4m [Trichomonascus vanleenenianus]|uniref:mitochondrial 37S ribosomal protein uS4m NAM9 n=1 Tax=Trichomonascus vanleenenianus TaxID=2268995 RepID=UPI003ECA47F4